MSKFLLRCYTCGNSVNMEDLLKTDMEIEHLIDKDTFNPGEYVAHCEGDVSFFHPNYYLEAVSLVNICPFCLKRILRYAHHRSLCSTLHL